MTKKIIATATLLGCTLIAQLAMVGAQIPIKTEIHGSVTDASGAVIPAAMVTISNGAFSRTVSTDDSGEYTVANLAPGHLPGPRPLRWLRRL